MVWDREGHDVVDPHHPVNHDRRGKNRAQRGQQTRAQRGGDVLRGPVLSDLLADPGAELADQRELIGRDSRFGGGEVEVQRFVELEGKRGHRLALRQTGEATLLDGGRTSRPHDRLLTSLESPCR